MINGNNQYWQNAAMNIRKDNDEWKNAAGTCSANLIEKSVTENGEYYAKDDNADGYSSVKVEVPSAPTALVATFTAPTGPDSLTCDKTHSEIMSAINSDVLVKFYISFGGSSPVLANGYATVNTATSPEEPDDFEILVFTQLIYNTSESTFGGGGALEFKSDDSISLIAIENSSL